MPCAEVCTYVCSFVKCLGGVVGAVDFGAGASLFYWLEFPFHRVFGSDSVCSVTLHPSYSVIGFDATLRRVGPFGVAWVGLKWAIPAVALSVAVDSHLWRR